MDQRPSFWSDLWRHHWYKVPWNHWIDTGDNCRATGSTHSWEVHRGWWFTRLLTWCQRWWHAVCYWHNWLEEWHLRVPWDKGNGYDWQVIWRVKRRDWGRHGTWYWPLDFSDVCLDRGAYNLIFGDPPDDLRGARQWIFLRKRTFFHWNCTVRVFKCDKVMAYSQGRRRKHKSTVTRSATAEATGVCLLR